MTILAASYNDNDFGLAAVAALKSLVAFQQTNQYPSTEFERGLKSLHENGLLLYIIQNQLNTYNAFIKNDVKYAIYNYPVMGECVRVDSNTYLDSIRFIGDPSDPEFKYPDGDIAYLDLETLEVYINPKPKQRTHHEQA